MLRRWIEQQEVTGNLNAVKDGQDLLGKYGDVSLDNEDKIPTLVSSPKQPAVIDLETEWLIKANRLAFLYAKELGQSREQYIDYLPKFEPQPESYRYRFYIPAIVQVPQGKLTLVRMLDILGVTNYLLNLRDIKDWQKDPQKFKTPNKPYTTYLHDGLINLGRTPRDVRSSLVYGERGGTVFDGLALLAQDPDILKNHYLDLPGSQYGSGGVPFLGGWGARPGLRYFRDDSVGPKGGSVVAGRNIVTK
ncbi:MAG: hypothetical protein HYW45_03580 [Candidatus Daviesbacteria bacterium]|nr:MAG: hypothetical protein HYW45_03580 [Candidatus Daviesbacteria bacterium]